MTGRVRLLKMFGYVCTFLLLFTGFAKLISAFGGSELLERQDPVIPMQVRHLFILAGALEVAMGFNLVYGKNNLWKYLPVLLFSCVAMSYRMLVFFAFGGGNCPCLGNVADWIPLSKATINAFLTFTLLMLIFGSSVILRQYWRRGSRIPKVQV